MTNNLARAEAAAPMGHVSLADMANAIRALSMDAVEAANSGHPGMPMGMADVGAVLFTQFLKYDPSAPNWPDRDRFVLSAGHGSMFLYSVLHLTGYPDMTIDQIRRFRQRGSMTAGHPEYGHAPGIETTTGPLGQGIATAVGMAIAERLTAARYGDAICDHHTYVIAGDGCLMEGISHEAIDLAGHLRLSKLIVLFDDNSISIDGPTSLSTSMDQIARFKAAGWNAMRVDGHDTDAVAAALTAAKTSDRPTMIACKTIIGKGSPNRQGTEKCHGSPLGPAEMIETRKNLGWPHEPFTVPVDILAAWREAGAKGQKLRQAWEGRLNALPADKRKVYNDALNGDVGAHVHRAIDELKAKFAAEKPKLASRKSGEMVLQVINDATEMTIGGSADLTHSNFTITKGMRGVTAEDFGGRYIYYGIREHGMAAAMNGIALHGGFIPYGGTFLVFTDYCRPAIRLSALMGQRVIYVMTHDSIGLGEDGPTHQPVEHLAALRAMPNVTVFRPADAVETAEAWQCALENKCGPSIICLSRQGLQTFRENSAENFTSLGGYMIAEPGATRDVTLLATGSEVAIAMDAAKKLSAEGVNAGVVSLPSFELFKRQPREYRMAVLGKAPRVGVEAAVRDSWDQFIGPDGHFIGMTGFGASAPIDDLYKHFGITADAVVAAARAAIAEGNA
ncbi:MAG: transketolase [Chitinophagales bacterium]|nr:transketolase [Hyphomicrobiales bacterium]